MSTAHSSIVTMQVAALLAPTDTDIVVRQGTTFSEHVAHSSTRKDRCVGELYRRLLPRADKIIAISKGVKKDLVDSTSVSEDEIEVIYNPAISSVEQVEEKSKTPPDHPWFSEVDEPIILGAGRLTDQKDFPTLIKAFRRVRERIDCKLIIIGEGSDREELLSLVSDLDIEDHVSLPGYIDNPYRYMKHSDVFVLSSAWEGFGVVLIEAMACGTPIVSTDCKSGPAEILQDGEFGYLSPVGDHNDIALGIESMIESPTEPAKLKSRAEEFTIKNVKQYEEYIYG
jgi:glycosyltransferase involved in cell wall biosynthesis